MKTQPRASYMGRDLPLNGAWVKGHTEWILLYREFLLDYLMNKNGDTSVLLAIYVTITLSAVSRPSLLE